MIPQRGCELNTAVDSHAADNDYPRRRHGGTDIMIILVTTYQCVCVCVSMIKRQPSDRNDLKLGTVVICVRIRNYAGMRWVSQNIIPREKYTPLT